MSDKNVLHRTVRDLCRAKCLDNGKWVEGNLIRSFDAEDGWSAIIIPTTDSDMFTGPGTKQDLGFENWYRVAPDTVCHCLGMTDNNKQLIFEKDFVEFVLSPASSKKYLLWWNNEMQCMTVVDMDKIYFNGLDYNDGNPNFSYETFCLMMQDPYGDFKDIKVTDNIVDNPDLAITACEKNKETMEKFHAFDAFTPNPAGYKEEEVLKRTDTVVHEYIRNYGVSNYSGLLHSIAKNIVHEAYEKDAVLTVNAANTLLQQVNEALETKCEDLTQEQEEEWEL